MGQGSNSVDVYDAGGVEASDSYETQTLTDDIEMTRSNMTGTIAAIGEKLNPLAVAEEAKGVAADAAQHARDAAVEIIENIKETLPAVASDAAHKFVSTVIEDTKGAVNSAVETSKNALDGAVNSARGASMTIIDKIQQNPIPAAVVGIGLYWLLKGGQSRYPYASPGYVPP